MMLSDPTIPPGTGKSFLLRVLRDLLKDSGLLKVTAFTAPTGVAACNIQGLTLHSWAGIGLSNRPLSQLLSEVMSNPGAKRRWRETQLLVIDEVKCDDR